MDIIQPITELLDELTEDINRCNEHIKNEDSQFWRRAVYRTTFATIEGLINHTKKASLAFFQSSNNDIDPFLRMALSGMTYDIDSEGQITNRPLKISLKNNLQFGFGALARALDRDYKLNKSDNGWNALTKAIKVRDRLMHPKSVEDLRVCEQDMKYLIEGWEWFGKELCNLTRVCPC